MKLGNAPGAGIYDVGATPQVPVFMKLGNAPDAGVYEVPRAMPWALIKRPFRAE